MLRSLLLSLCLLLAAGATQAAAKPASIKVPVPAAGKASAVFANLKGKGTKLSAKRVPKGITVLGSAANGKLAVVASRPKNGRAKGPIVLTLQGAKASLTWTLKDIAKGGVPAEFCAGLGTMWSKVLRSGAGSKDGAALASAAGCGETPKPTGGVQLPAPNTPLAKPPTTGATSKPSTGQNTNPGNNNGGNTTTDACKNGKDDDGDGQSDFRGPGVTNPDPGCSSAGDTSEGDELLVNDSCASTSGVFKGPQGVSAALNGDCPDIADVYMTIRPGVTGCTVVSADSNYDCKAENGYLHAFKTTGAFDNQLDFFTITLSGAVDCATSPTITIVSPDGTVAELVKPWPNSCGDAEEPPPAAACANGIDDDGDGQADAIDAEGATTPDPGCTSTTDTTENSEIAPPAGCTVTVGHLTSANEHTAFNASGCGTLTGAWFNPSRQAQDCVFALGGAASWTECSVVGSVGSATFTATSQALLMAAPVDLVPLCGDTLTVALKRQDGTVIEENAIWDDETC